MKIGIFFGGPSREREISFAGGRTVYDNLNKTLFEPVPVFVDSIGNFILLNWQYVYKGTIRDFYPPQKFTPFSPNGFQVYIESLGELSSEEQDRIISTVGQRIEPKDFRNYFDFAFLALHGPYGEDGNIQGLLEWYHIPYSGSGILPSAIGISKTVQQKLLSNAGFKRPKNVTLSKQEWFSNSDKEKLLLNYKNEIGLPFVIKAPNQGSSIGITIISDPSDLKNFIYSVNKAFFIQQIEKSDWGNLSYESKVNYLRVLTDIRDGIGMPVMADGHRINHPEELLHYMDEHFSHSAHTLYLESLDNEEEILIESFIKGKEFSCIVIQDEKGNPIALPPTEIVKGNNFFDYRSKYLPGMSRKVTPIDLPTEQIDSIRKQCEKLYRELNFNVYARLDGFITTNWEIFLNDPNTTSGMLPSSFFFHQAAEIGMNPSQFLTYIIRTSLSERIITGKNTYKIKSLLSELDAAIDRLNSEKSNKIRVAVIMGGFSSERHISVESGRNIYEKLSSSSKYEPLPIFLTGSEENHELYIVPINVMLKDNADDIKEKITHNDKHPVIKQIIKEAKSITGKYVHNAITESKKISYKELSELIDVVFIALHGRPGEDGAVQAELEKLNIPYNGSGVHSSETTINKFETNKILRENGIPVANSMLVYKQEWENFYFDLMHKIEDNFTYPFIAKPSDDGCSSAVKKINNRDELVAYAKMMFGWDGIKDSESAKILKLKFNEEFPQKNYFMVEDIIRKDGGKHFLEITGGLLTHYDEHGNVHYELFEPSETLASGEVLSLEEKFLAGEGQNITPARYASDEGTYRYISEQVKDTLRRTAEVLNVQGYARIDAFVRIYDNNKAETIVIEINSLPGMTPATCIFHQTALNGYKPYDFIDKILSFGMERVKKSVHN